MEVLAERQSLVLVHRALCIALERTLAALLAINRRYDPGLKWLPQIVQSLAIAPDALGERIGQCFDGDVRERVKAAAALVEDTFDLTALHLPDLDLAARRAVFRQRRPPIDAAPPGIELRSGATSEQE